MQEIDHAANDNAEVGQYIAEYLAKGLAQPCDICSKPSIGQRRLVKQVDIEGEVWVYWIYDSPIMNVCLTHWLKSSDEIRKEIGNLEVNLDNQLTNIV